METYPALIEVILLNDKTVSYKENLPFRTDPNEDEVKSFIKLIRPTTKGDHLIMDYIRPLKNIEL